MSARRRGRAAALVALLLTLAATPAVGQGGGPRGRGGRGAPVEQLLKRRVGLTDGQIARLRATRQTFAPERMGLARRERAIADSLRQRIDAQSGRDEQAVAALITRLFGVRRERLALREREQTALAAFMTPSQRATLLGLEEEAQRRASAMRGRRRGGRQ